MAKPVHEDRPRVLVLDEEIPIPPNSGKRIRTLNLLRRLTERFRIELLVHGGGISASGRSALEGLGILVHAAESQLPEKRGIRFFMALAANLLSPLPYSVASHHLTGYRRAVDRLIAGRGYDLVHCEWTPYAVYRTDRALPWVISAHNIEADVWARLSATQSDRVRRAYFGLQAARMLRFEQGVFAKTRFATAVSERDRQRIEGWGCARACLVPNGVDLEMFRRAPEDRSHPKNVVFVGSMDWRANADGVRWFLDRVHPRLRGLEGYRLRIVGRRPPRWLRDRGGASPRITIVGEVDDVRPELVQGAVVIVPLRVGGGSRLKILEAMSIGRPVVSTSIGAEGLEVVDGEHIRIADDPEGFAEAIRVLLRDATFRERIAAQARRLVEERYDWNAIAPVQAALWREAIGQAPASLENRRI